LPVQYRIATPADADLLAPLNLELIQAEGHRNPMNLSQLAGRMAGWLQGEYEAVIFEQDGQPLGYALYRREPDYVYLRQFYVVADRRRQGIGRDALRWLWGNCWVGASRLRIEVLVGNIAARRFWQAVGFQEYAIIMEAPGPGPE
jgi:GNAT superfamily N-acetyltransferase